MNIKNISVLSTALLAVSISACTSKDATVKTNATAANNSNNVAVVKNSNAAATNTAAVPMNTAANSGSNAASTDGQTLTLDEAGIVLTVPKGMNYSKDGQDTIVKTQDEGVDTRFRVLKDDNMEKSFDEAFKEIDEYVSNSKLESKEPKKTSQNGLEVYSWNGTGKASNGDDVQFELAIVDAGSDKKPLMALTYAESESLKKHQADLAKFFQSIRKQ